MAIQMIEHAAAQQDGGSKVTSDLTVTLLRRAFGDGRFTLDVTFVAPAGITVLFGASGAGKTSVLDCIAGLVRPDSGRVAVGERILFDSTFKTNIPVSDRRVGYVVQTLALFPHMSLAQNIAYGLAGLAAGEQHRRVQSVAESFSIAHLLDRRPRDVSGGERQRVALARTLVTDPLVLLLDEPLAGIDLPTKSRLIDDLRTWNDNHRIPILYVTHDRSEVFALAEKVIALEQGRVIAQGDSFEVLESPQRETVARLAGCENIFEAEVQALHEDRGTMTCALGPVHLEVPLSRAEVGSTIRLGVRAGDILLATIRPEKISARNIIKGHVQSLTRREAMAVAQVDCGAVFEVHLTPHAQEALGLALGAEVWLVLKTHSCHLLRR